MNTRFIGLVLGFVGGVGGLGGVSAHADAAAPANTAAPTSVAAPAADLILIHARVYSAPGAPPIEDGTIQVHDGRIASVSAAGANSALVSPAAPVTPGAQILDCTGLTVTAGLWNSHVHLLPVTLLQAADKTAAQLGSALQDMFTAWGFTTVFDIASVLDNTKTIRARIATGEVPGPRILTTGEPFFAPHGVPSYVKDYLAQNHIVLPDDPTIPAAVARVHREISDGADGIKIFTGSVEGRDVLLMPVDRATAIVQEAHRLHRPVFAHPTTPAGIEIALDSGVDVLAHVTSSEDRPWAPVLVQRMRAANMALIPTLTLFDVEVKKDGGSPELQRQIVGRAVARLREYTEAGGEILFGTDVGYIYQFDPSEEYTLMQQAGLSFEQILASLTTNPARRFGSSGHSGRIAEHGDADLTVVDGNPATDITALAHVRYTIRAGRIIYQAPAR